MREEEQNKKIENNPTVNHWSATRRGVPEIIACEKKCHNNALTCSWLVLTWCTVLADRLWWIIDTTLGSRIACDTILLSNLILIFTNKAAKTIPQSTGIIVVVPLWTFITVILAHISLKFTNRTGLARCCTDTARCFSSRWTFQANGRAGRWIFTKTNVAWTARGKSYCTGKFIAEAVGASGRRGGKRAEERNTWDDDSY